MAGKETLIAVDNVSVAYGESGGLLRARTVNTVLSGVSLSIPRGQTVGVVGESGSGKTTLGRAILGLVPLSSGTVRYFAPEGAVELNQLSEAGIRPYRKRLQIVFQDPFSSLNPRMCIRDILEEGLRYHYGGLNASERLHMCSDALDRVGLPNVALERYPHEFSGGQRQRVSIARALVLQPDFIVCDECVSALDVSIQAQILNLLMDLQSTLNLSYLFISHDLSVVNHISQEIIVIEKGRIVEHGSAEEVVNRPKHRYTQELIESIPSLVPFR